MLNLQQYNHTSKQWYEESKCPQPKLYVSPILEAVLIIVGIMLIAGFSYGGFYAFTKYRQQGEYFEQNNIDQDDDASDCPPIYEDS